MYHSFHPLKILQSYYELIIVKFQVAPVVKNNNSFQQHFHKDYLHPFFITCMSNAVAENEEIAVPLTYSESIINLSHVDFSFVIREE